ncbi:hypothetical protein [Parasitella parasitica]|uniref:Uncharacterized protein n=1 Tax=Parasitella parasitica TaxID=35722 RepID=A0A0B7MSD4_9FUNG|nr:hypothetical protein [Parasitella parasitica]
MDFTEYLRILGWILTAAFPVVVVYLTGGPDKEPLLDDVEYEARKRKKALAEKRKKKEAEEKQALLEASNEPPKKTNKKKSNKKTKATAIDVVQDNTIKSVERSQQQQQPRKRKNAKREEQQNDIIPIVAKEEKERPTKKESNTAAAAAAVVVVENKEDKKPLLQIEKEEQEKIKEIDEHMDPTVNYARVMRIKPEEEEEAWEAVPAEEGWSQVKSRRPLQASSTLSKNSIDRNAAINADQINNHIPGLDKKQRENLARQQKKKQQKAAADALQAERLRKHQKDLEKIRIQEFYSSGKGKNSPWGKNGQQQRSSKVPTSTAGINEYGQLIWD